MPATTRKVTRPAAKTTKTSVKRVATMFQEWRTLRGQAQLLDERVEKLKDDLSAVVETQGVEDDGGNYWLDLDDPVDGYKALKRQKSTSRRLDASITERILRERGLWKTVEEGGCIRMVEAIDEDAIDAAYFQGELSSKDVKAMTVVKTWYSFVPIKE